MSKSSMKALGTTFFLYGVIRLLDAIWPPEHFMPWWYYLLFIVAGFMISAMALKDEANTGV